ncbi:type III polyketide synthase [Yinghuangia sp. YIM S09857]|uniref:type III polyketide synthase n=1 Tax=Yinghuangia sp. YIM S09857 TaxID=3436929 RepID=UPI003F53C02B
MPRSSEKSDTSVSALLPTARNSPEAAFAAQEVRPPARTGPVVAGVGTAVPATSYTQRELVDRFGVTDERAVGFFLNGGIERRYLTLPEGSVDKETRHLDLAERALRAATDDAGIAPAELGYLAVATSTGFMVPGLSARVMASLRMDPAASRVDVVGMGCNAGLNALGPLASWAQQHPGRPAALVCVESFSGAFIHDGSLGAAVVNSLFGDGAAAVVLRGDAGPEESAAAGPRLLDFASLLVPDAIEAMRVEWDASEGKRRFILERDVPRVVAQYAGPLVDRLTAANGLTRDDIAHWCVHSGGRKVVEAVRTGLALSDGDLRNTTGILRDFGNVSSGSFLFSLERLRAERITKKGEFAIMMTMGPGTTIETALLRF